jgi:hypothetical protein
MMTTETNQLRNSSLDPAIWSIAAVLGVAIVYVACLV